ncbi:hypothetical protein [Methanobacterium spitsbergense]|jgi:hypothetical protein|uniref:Uncharacterized protein n=1 Tax=Methanobacterium spitsbergense TaxID=2874285 RepID=A0A8T5V1L2_9EURY|nr:hypothetical protein [Methanobacterium spitsbergense]MBZ2166849.1 hypothetical protein [Methanobacterium spitsbergense]
MVKKTELKQKIVGIGFEDDLIVRSQRGKMYSVKLADDLEIDINELLAKESDKTIWANIDTEADIWVITDVEINDD